MDFRLFIPITKVDAGKRLVYGTIAEEIPDRAGEIMDYATSAPEFQAWSDGISKATDGANVGNLRAMHGNVAAGKLTSISFDEANKKIEACGKIVDDAEWNKVLEGVYTGFSMGGKYGKRWKDADAPHLTRYTALPAEVSLVDNPCIPTATFEVVKADGSTELRKFKPHAAAASPAEEALAKLYDAIETAAAKSMDRAMEHGEHAGDDAPAGELAKITAERDALAKILADVPARVDAALAKIAQLAADVERLNAQPMPGGPVVNGTRTITKSEDAAGCANEPGADAVKAFQKHLETLAPGARALALMKFSLANPLSAAPEPRR